MATTLAGLITEFSGKYKINNLAEDDNGIITFFIDGHSIQVFESLSKIYLETQIGLMPSEKFHRAELLKTLLQASLANASEYQVSLFLDKNKDALCMYQSISTEQLNIQVFESLLEKFMYALDGFSECTPRNNYSDRPRLIAI